MKGQENPKSSNCEWIEGGPIGNLEAFMTGNSFFSGRRRFSVSAETEKRLFWPNTNQNLPDISPSLVTGHN